MTGFPMPRKRWNLCLLLAALAITGCAEAPVPGMSSLNPWLRKEWADDEKLGTTYYQKQTELANVRSRAGSYPPAERQQIVTQLATRYREEPGRVLRADIIRTLAAFPDSLAEETLLVAATDQDATVRRLACEGLGSRKSTEALNALAQTVGTDTEAEVRVAAARSLRNFKDPIAVRALGVALEENDAAMQFVAMDSLKVVTGKSYGTSVPAWKEYVQGGSPAPVPGPSIASQMRDWLYWY